MNSIPAAVYVAMVCPIAVCPPNPKRPLDDVKAEVAGVYKNRVDAQRRIIGAFPFNGEAGWCEPKEGHWAYHRGNLYFGYIVATSYHKE